MASSAGSAGGAAHLTRGTRTATVKFPLPPPNSVQVSSFVVHATAPKGKRVGALRIRAKNAQALGSPQLNTQQVAVISPKSSKRQRATFRVWLFVHRFSPVGRRTASAAQDEEVDDVVDDSQPGVVIGIALRIADDSCDQLAHAQGETADGQRIDFSFLGDDWGSLVEKNLVPAFDTPVEEQIDNAVFSKPCDGAENPADDPPPV